MKHRFFYIFLMSIFVAPNLYSQGFNVFNDRNHPYLDWQVAETEHFEIIYPNRISGIEAKAAAIAEESYRALSKNLDVEFENRIRVYLADMDEIKNGFANPIGQGYTMIWVNLNDYTARTTGQAKWLRHVIAHELGHIFHFKATWTNMGLLQYLFGNPTPMFWTEGIAQYQTEEWNSQRGDRWLRKAIFDSRPDYRDGQSIENPRLMYAKGNSQLRYLTEVYGDSTLAGILAHRDKRLGLFEYHDMENAFDAVLDGYDSFYEEWRKHVNVYYNTLASQMERVDSLQSEKLDLPGQFMIDMAVNPDGQKIAVLSVPSLQRPVRNLYIVEFDSTQSTQKVAEGAINNDLRWSRDGETLYYSRRIRGEKSSIVHDIFSLDAKSGREKQLTHSRRAGFPTDGLGENEISYIVNEDGTSNLFTMNLESKEERQKTHFEGDIQLHWPLWVETKERWLLYRFDENGNRNFILYEPDSGQTSILDEGELDNRKPYLSPDGKKFVFTSLRDEVPNVFIYDFEEASSTRITNLFTGGEAFGFIAEPDTLEGDQILISASETKRRDSAMWISADRTPYIEPNRVPEPYASWRQKAPPNTIPRFVDADESLITNRYAYSSVRNITHAASFALPYYAGPNDWGLFATTNWTEPLGKHLISALGLLSFANPSGNSYGSVNYLNNQFYPSVGLSLYRTPGNSRFYDDRFLIEELTGGELYASYPLDRFEAPYRSSRLGVRLRHVQIDPIRADRFDDRPAIPQPISGRQTDVTLEWSIKKQRPWTRNHIHPLDGTGLRVALQGADKLLGSDTRFVETDLHAYTVLPSIGQQRLFIQARAQHQFGDPLPQQTIGFTRYDNITMDLPDQLFISFFQDSERVRGYRSFVRGSSVLFGSAEYRMPFIPSMNTTILGILGFGSTTLSLFTDAGVVRNAIDENGAEFTERRWGAGAEIKNSVRLLGLNFTHAVGIAQPAQELFTDTDPDLYYRVRAVVPF